MIIAPLNQKGGVGKTTLAVRFADQWARQGKQATLIGVDQRGSATDWSEQRTRRLAARSREAGGMTGRGSDGAFADRPRNAGSSIKSPDPTAYRAMAADLYTVRLTVDITPALCGWLEIAVFERGVIVADMPRDPTGREFPDTDGDCS